MVRDKGCSVKGLRTVWTTSMLHVHSPLPFPVLSTLLLCFGLVIPVVSPLPSLAVPAPPPSIRPPLTPLLAQYTPTLPEHCKTETNAAPRQPRTPPLPTELLQKEVPQNCHQSYRRGPTSPRGPPPAARVQPRHPRRPVASRPASGWWAPRWVARLRLKDVKIVAAPPAGNMGAPPAPTEPHPSPPFAAAGSSYTLHKHTGSQPPQEAPGAGQQIQQSGSAGT